MQLTDTGRKDKRTKGNKPPLTQESKRKQHPEINFKYLYKCDVCCFKGLNKHVKKSKDISVYDDLQKFLNEIDDYDSLEDVISGYTSPNGSKLSKTKHDNIVSSNLYVNNLIKKFKSKYPKETGLLESGIIHIHTKKNGKGKFVIFGVNYENVFYVLSFDPEHSFDSH